MRLAPRLAILVVLLAAVVVAPASGPDPRPPAPGLPAPHVTVEPAPPLVIELRTEAADPAAGHGRGPVRLMIDLDAGPAVREVALRLILPDGVQAIADPLPSGPFEIAAGARRSWVALLSAPGAGGGAVQVEASYRVGEGATLLTRQATVLQREGAPVGRHHAGAWEVPAQVLEEGTR